ncbi:unnamed protein product [Caenorhabditis bovis]|uniref:SXP/RAL-2 family protein Ani s 5-like cation-binding domain-containing protein n=1 Tax=Caenorhabditis bovis TaxID=2654633 RepID=A0A8S1F5Q6_9PELO|nr:unnamed protein product [Caenorhabditis bovis]
MRVVLIVAATIMLTAADDVSSEQYSAREGLIGHGGIFKLLDWTDYELAMISSLHATASYPELMKLVKQKLVDAELHASERRRIERMLIALRPPAVFNNFLNEAEKQKIRKAHSHRDIEYILGTINKKIEQLPPTQKSEAVNYMLSHSPAMPDDVNYERRRSSMCIKRRLYI